VWVYQRTGSATEFALISVAAILPSILVSPVAGAIVDRYDRRKVMIFSDVCAGLSTVAMALLLFSGSLQIWHIYIASMISSAAGAFQAPAYGAATTLLVPKEHYGRAAGLVSTAQGISHIVAPALAGVLITVIGLQSIMLIDFATFLFAVGTLLLVRFPSPKIEQVEQAKTSITQDMRSGWRYLLDRRGLFWLIVYFTFINFTFSIVHVLLTPMVLSFATTEGLGLIISAIGVGMLVGSVLMGIWGGPKRRMIIVFTVGILQGVVMIVSGWQESVALIALVYFVVFIFNPIINGSFKVLLQTKIAPNMQGRVFSTVSMLAMAAMPVGFVLSGPLADNVFEPLMALQGSLAGSVGQIIGAGEGRGMALMYVIAGLLTLLGTLALYLYPPARNIERDLPDVTPDELKPPDVEMVGAETLAAAPG
jgi:MFS family permease